MSEPGPIYRHTPMPDAAGQALGERREAILAYISDYISEHGWAPSNREIGRALGISSTAVVAWHLHKLCDLGYIEMGPGARQIRVIQGDVSSTGHRSRS